MSDKIRSDDAWKDYLYWNGKDRKILRKINQLIKDIERNGSQEGIGKQEVLTSNLQGEYSRRVNEKERLVYHMEDAVFILYIAKDIMGGSEGKVDIFIKVVMSKVEKRMA